MPQHEKPAANVLIIDDARSPPRLLSLARDSRRVLSRLYFDFCWFSLLVAADILFISLLTSAFDLAFAAFRAMPYFRAIVAHRRCHGCPRWVFALLCAQDYPAVRPVAAAPVRQRPLARAAPSPITDDFSRRHAYADWAISGAMASLAGLAYRHTIGHYRFRWPAISAHVYYQRRPRHFFPLWPVADDDWPRIRWAAREARPPARRDARRT